MHTPSACCLIRRSAWTTPRRWPPVLRWSTPTASPVVGAHRTSASAIRDGGAIDPANSDRAGPADSPWISERSAPSVRCVASDCSRRSRAGIRRCQVSCRIRTRTGCRASFGAATSVRSLSGCGPDQGIMRSGDGIRAPSTASGTAGTVQCSVEGCAVWPYATAAGLGSNGPHGGVSIRGRQTWKWGDGHGRESFGG